MLFIIVALVVVISLAVFVTAFAAYPQRGEPIPHVEWLSDRLRTLHERIEP